MPRKNDVESTRDRKKNCKRNSLTPYSKKHVRKVEEIQSRGSTVPGQGKKGPSKNRKGKKK